VWLLHGWLWLADFQLGGGMLKIPLSLLLQLQRER
jgi:hypothetical protein